MSQLFQFILFRGTRSNGIYKAAIRPIAPIKSAPALISLFTAAPVEITFAPVLVLEDVVCDVLLADDGDAVGAPEERLLDEDTAGIEKAAAVLDEDLGVLNELDGVV
jgi:hypothetical protein